MPLTVLDHALGAHILTRLREETTLPEAFRPLTRALTQILVVEATRTLPTENRHDQNAAGRNARNAPQ